MGLDVSACLVIGVKSSLVYKDTTIEIEVPQVDKHGNKYMQSISKDVKILGNKQFDDDTDDFYEELDKYDLRHFNDEYPDSIIGYELEDTGSHRNDTTSVELEPLKWQTEINRVRTIFESNYGIDPSLVKLYLVSEASY